MTYVYEKIDYFFVNVFFIVQTTCDYVETRIATRVD